MSLSFGTNKSNQAPVIEPAAITPEQRAQLFPQIGNLLGFNWNQTGTTPITTSYAQDNPRLYPGSPFNNGFNFRQPVTSGGQPIYSFSPKDVNQNFGQIPMEGVNQYLKMFMDAVNNPYTPTSAENQLLSNIMGNTSSQFANRGLGESPIAASTVGASIAPSLINMRQAALQNIMAGLGGEVNAGQNLLTQRGQDINATLTQRQQQLAGLLQFLEQMGFRRNLGQTGSSSGFNFGVGGSSPSTVVNVASPGGAGG